MGERYREPGLPAAQTLDAQRHTRRVAVEDGARGLGQVREGPLCMPLEIDGASEAIRCDPIDANDDNITMEDMISESTTQSPENLISVLKLHDELQQALQEIGDRERVILELRHGLTGQSPMTLEEVGKRLKLSRERIRQIEERALLRLRRVANRMGLIELNEPRPMGSPNLQPGWNMPKPRTDILGNIIPEGRRTADRVVPVKKSRKKTPIKRKKTQAKRRRK